MYTMKECSQITGLSEHTIRYYDREGLIPLLGRTPNGRRNFSEEDIEWIKLICCLKNSGMPLHDIKEFMQLCLDGQATCEQRKSLLLRHRQHILEQIRSLNESLEVVDCKIRNYKTVGTFHIDRPKHPDS